MHMSALPVRMKELVEPITRGNVKPKQRGGLLAVRFLGVSITHPDKGHCARLTRLHGKMEEWRE